eukprot:608235-Karenia_brevis.AAC.1
MGGSPDKYVHPLRATSLFGYLPCRGLGLRTKAHGLTCWPRGRFRAGPVLGCFVLVPWWVPGNPGCARSLWVLAGACSGPGAPCRSCLAFQKWI